jgi:hypothetical protein
VTNVAPIAPAGGDIIEAVITRGDLAKLSPAERTKYYVEVCRSIGLNPLTRPFEYLVLNGKTVLYARRDAADQLRKLNNISLSIVSQKIDGDLITVHVRAETRDGRTDEDFGAVNIAGLKGEARANATLKAITKAKRRVTLSIAGLGFLDESEVDDIEPRQPPGPPPSVAAELDTFAASAPNRLGLAVPDDLAPDADAVRLEAEAAAMRGTAAFRVHYKPLDAAERAILAPDMAEYRRIADEADEAAEEAQRDDDPFGLLSVEAPPFVDAPELPRSAIWDDVEYTVTLKSQEAGPQWGDWSTSMAHLAGEARTLDELDKLIRDNDGMMSRARRESGDDWRHVRDAVDARRQALT